MANDKAERISVTIAAGVLGVSVPTVYDLIRKDQLPAYLDATGRRWVKRSDAIAVRAARSKLTRDRMSQSRTPRRKRVAA